jgi:hypothetical protein
MNKTTAASAASSTCVHIPDISLNFSCSNNKSAGACEEPALNELETRHYLLDSLPNTVIEYCKRPNGVEKIPR